MPFITRSAPMPIAKSPEALFRELVRPPNGPPHLWVHQADLLRSYHRDHLGTSDVALELPTGAGKTLPGLLIAEWRRRAFSERVAYLCPTRQLARQVAEQATRYGIEVVVLVGSAQSWSEADRMRFVRGERVAITTYSAVFNSNPQIADAQTLVLDDAHAAEGFVAGAWTVQIDRDGGPAYEEVLSALANDLDDALLGRLRGPRPELGEAGDVQLVPVRAVHDRAAELHTVLATRLSGRAAFSFSMIRQQLGRCLIYLSWSSILIRPLIPPTFMHPAFDRANQHIYMVRRWAKAVNWNVHSGALPSRDYWCQRAGISTVLAGGSSYSPNSPTHRPRTSTRSCVQQLLRQRALGLGLDDQTLRSRLLEQFRSSRCIGTPLVERLSYRPLSSQDSAG
jgi:hypothetical protein